MGGLLCFLMNRMRRARKMAVRARLRWRQSAVCATSREINTQIFPDRGDLQTFSFQLRRGGQAFVHDWSGGYDFGYGRDWQPLVPQACLELEGGLGEWISMSFRVPIASTLMSSTHCKEYTHGT